MKNVGFFLIFIVLMTGCGANRQEGEPGYLQLLKSKPVETSGLFIARGSRMIIFQDQLIGLDEGFDDLFFDVSLRSPDKHMRFGKKGSGLGEFIHPYTIQVMNDTVFGVYDYPKKLYLQIRYEDKEILESVGLDYYSLDVFRTKYGQYIGLGAYREGMFCLFDSVGNKIDYFYQYPFKNEEERRIGNHLRGMASQDFVYALYSGLTLEDSFKDGALDSEGDYLFVYTWEGEKIKSYQLDFPCQRICIHPNEKELWAIRNNPDPELVVFDLD